MPSSHISLSGGLLTHQFIEAIQQTTFNHPALSPATFALPGQKTLSPAELERNIGAAWELLVERWDSIEHDIAAMDISTLRDRWIRPLFMLLDFFLEYQRADLVLEGELRFPISHFGLPTGAEQVRVPVHTVLPGRGGSAAGSLETRRDTGAGLRRLAPHDLLQRYLNLNRDAKWGILTDGLRLRLLRDYHHTYTRGYIEFDLQGIFTGRDFAAFRAIYRLCHASRFVEMREEKGKEKGKGRAKAAAVAVVEAGEETRPERLTPLESFYQHALSTGVKVGEDLRGRVRDAIETFANGFIQATPGLLSRLQNGEVQVMDFYNEILHTIYRILFLLFAEQRGMFPGRGSLYMDEYSLTALRAAAERPFGEDQHVDLWERLKATFSMVEHGAPGLDIFGYNGALFSASKTPILTPSPEDGGDREEAPALHNDSLLKAIRSLTTVERDNVLQRISYADLSVEEMGSVYESLLDYTPRIAAAPEKVDDQEIAAGEFFLDPRGKERKKTGSYYTHPSLVNELIKSALLPVLEDRLKAAVPGYDSEHPEKLTPDERQKAEEALLAIKVVDPAAGSGAFLIAADNTLGLRLAQIRSGDLYPQEHEVRRARRDVLANCLYAVDLNPMAVELCKVSLWINAVVEDQRLNFLNHHIKPGNSLIGIGPTQAVKLEDEVTLNFGELAILPEAFEPVSTDVKEIARAVRERNKREVEERKFGARQKSLWQVTQHFSPPALHYSDITTLSLSDPNEAERCYRNWAEEELYQLSCFAADLWTSSFFWQYDSSTSNRLEPPTDTRFRLACDEGSKVFEKEFIDEVERLRKQYRFFHWQLEFPDVFGPEGPGGFDVVLGNPPWERIKLQEKEFFAVHAPEVAAAPNAAARKRLIEALPQTDPTTWALYREALREAECTGKFLRASGRYPLTSSGDINTYSVFAELDRDLIAPNGRGGIIVPSGIATDFTNKDFFADLVETGRLASLFDFENRKKLFPEVDSRMKFSLLTLSGNNSPSPAMRERGPGGEGAEFAFFLLSTDDLNDPERRFTLTAADFALLNPNTRTCPIFRSRTDAELTRKLYRAAPVLINDVSGENPWDVSFSRMFDMTNDSGLFRTKEQLTQAGFALKGNRFEKGKDVWLPLYEAKMFWHFDHRYGTFENAINRTDTSLQSLNNQQYCDSFCLVRSWYWVDSKEVNTRFGHWKRQWAVGFRDITNSTNERTSIFTILPYAGFGNNAPLLITDPGYVIELCGLIANLCSLPFDFVARKKVGGTHINFFIAKQLPIYSPTKYTDDLLHWIVPKVLELTITASDLASYVDDVWRKAKSTLRSAILSQWDENARATNGGHSNAIRPEWAGPPDPDGFPRPPFKWDEERRAHLRAELDGLYAHLYGLTRDEFAYILDTFPIVRRKDEAKYGEFRTKRLCLEAYDRLVGSDLIPAEARELQKESVIGKEAAGSYQPPAGTKPVTGDRRPVTGERKTGDTALDPQSSARNQAEEKLTAKSQEPTPDNQQLSFTDYSLYRCEACGKRVLGYDRENHVREAHKGKEVGWKKVGK